MPKVLISIVLSLFIQAFCEFTVFDGSKLKSLSYQIDQNYDARPRISIENFNQEMISYYSWFASYGYCEDSEVPLYCCTNYINFFTRKWTIINETSTSQFYTYNFILWRNDEFKKYILAFPGTNEAAELIKELTNCKLIEYDEGSDIKVLKYFKNVADEMKGLIFTNDIIKDIQKHKGYQFIATGHSLGAAIATLVLYEAVRSGYVNPNQVEPVLVTYGQPRTGNQKFVIDFNKKIKNVFRVVRYGDIVTNLPTSISSTGYSHLGGLVLVNRDMTTMTYCPKEIGEDYSDKECKNSLSVDVQYHVYYFNPDTKFSKRCRS